jgi:Ohr subfamily peroxiredoxin
MPHDLRYRTVAVARDGAPPWVRSDDGALQAELSTPEALGGAGGAGTNAEQLLAAGYAACLLSAMRFEGLRHGLDAGGAEVRCRVELTGSEAGFSVDVALEATAPRLGSEDARRLLEAACAAWPYAEGRERKLRVELAEALAA